MSLTHQDSLHIAGRTVIVARSAAEYAERAHDMGKDYAPIPVLDASWQQFVSSASLSTAETGTPQQHWQGTVFVCDSDFAAVGEVLALSTGRTLRCGDFATAVALSRTTPVTVVGGSGTIAPNMLAAIPHDAQLGLFIGRSLAATSALAARTLLYGPTAAASFADLSFDTLAEDHSAPDRLMGKGATPAGLRAAIGEGIAVLTGHGHARDCLMNLNGGGICGRAEVPSLEPVMTSIGDQWSEHPTACQQSDRCWKNDFTVDSHLRGGDIRAAFVVLDSCRTAQAGSGSIRRDVSLPLMMLEGNAIAVACGVGTRGGAPFTGQLFRALVRAGLSLGQVLCEINGAIKADRAGVGKLALFGDAGLVPAPTPRSPMCDPMPFSGHEGIEIISGQPALIVSNGELIAVDREGPLVIPRASGDSSWLVTTVAEHFGGLVVPAPPKLDAAWTERVRPWLDRLRGLSGMGLQVDQAMLDSVHRRATAAVQARAEAGYLRPAQDAVASFKDVLAELSHIQSHLIESEIKWVSTTDYAFTHGWPEPWQATTDPMPTSCPQCGIQAAIQHKIRPAGGAAPSLSYLVCVRCGEVLAGSEIFPGRVTTQSPPEVRCGDTFVVRVSVTAPPDRPLDVALGASFLEEKRFHCALANTKSFALAAGECRTVQFTGTTDADRTIPDLQPFKILIAADGAVHCLTRGVWMRARANDTGH